MKFNLQNTSVLCQIRIGSITMNDVGTSNTTNQLQTHKDTEHIRQECCCPLFKIAQEWQNNKATPMFEWRKCPESSKTTEKQSKHNPVSGGPKICFVFPIFLIGFLFYCLALYVHWIWKCCFTRACFHCLTVLVAHWLSHVKRHSFSMCLNALLTGMKDCFISSDPILTRRKKCSCFFLCFCLCLYISNLLVSKKKKTCSKQTSEKHIGNKHIRNHIVKHVFCLFV